MSRWHVCSSTCKRTVEASYGHAPAAADSPHQRPEPRARIWIPGCDINVGGEPGLVEGVRRDAVRHLEGVAGAARARHLGDREGSCCRLSPSMISSFRYLTDSASDQSGSASGRYSRHSDGIVRAPVSWPRLSSRARWARISAAASLSSHRAPRRRPGNRTRARHASAPRDRSARKRSSEAAAIGVLPSASS